MAIAKLLNGPDGIDLTALSSRAKTSDDVDDEGYQRSPGPRTVTYLACFVCSRFWNSFTAIALSRWVGA